MNYFSKNGGSLNEINFTQMFQNLHQEHLYGCLKSQTNLQILNFSDNHLTVNDFKAIGKILTEFKFIKELRLRSTHLSVANGSKDIADGLMRAKQMEILDISDNGSLDAQQIIYNLAFSPKIKHLDITNNKTSNNANCAEALYKLISISGSITTLLLGNTDILKNLK